MKIQLKRSNVLEAGTAKEPTSAQMEYGELAVNYNGNDPALFIKDSNDNIIRIAGVGAVGSEVPSGGSGQRPIDPSIGDLYFDTDLDLILYYDGGNWVPVGEGAYVKVAGDNMTGNLTLGTNKITLNATSGSGAFTGKVTSASTTSSDPGATLVTKDYVDSNDFTPGDGALTIRTSGGDTASGTFSANQSGPSTITLPAISYDDLVNVPDDAAAPGNGALTIQTSGGDTATGTYTANQNTASTLTLPAIDYGDLTNKPAIPSVGDGTITITQPGTANQTFTVNQTGNTTIALKNDNTVVTPGDGALTIKTSGGDSASGTFTANSSAGGTLTLPPISYEDLVDVPPDAAAPGNGALTIQTSGGDTATGTFTANQNTASTLTLPAIDYDDLTNKPTIPTVPTVGSGTITIAQPGSPNQTFNVNQSGNTTINLRNDDTVVTPGNGALTIKTSGGDSASGTFTANSSSGGTLVLPAIDYGDLTNKPNIPTVPTVGNGTITITQPGTTNQTFTVNQTGNTTIALKNDNTVVTPGNGALTIRNYGDNTNSTGTFTANQSSGSVITLPQVKYSNISGTPTIPTVPTVGNGTITIKQPGTTDQTFTVNQTGNTTINLRNDNTVTTPGNGAINFNAGNGLSSVGDNATANQSSSTTKTFSVKAANSTISVSSSGISVNTSALPSAPGTNLSNTTTTTAVSVNSSTGNNTSIASATSSKAGVMSTSQYNTLYGALQKTGGTMTGLLTLAGSGNDQIIQGSTNGNSKCGIAGAANQEVGLFGAHINNTQSFRIVYQGAELSHSSPGVPGINYGAERIGMTWGSPRVTFHINTGNAGYVTLTASDSRLKENIASIGSIGLNVINQLRPVSFNWLDTTFRYRNSDVTAGGNALLRYGFIADEVIDVIPQADTTPDPDDIEPDPKKDYDSRTIIAFLTKAVQELSADNDDLKQRVAALEAP